MVKRVFSLPLRGLQGFINSIFKLAQLPLSCPHYSCISKRAKTVNVAFKTKTKATIQHLAIDATGLKVYGEGEWKVKKHGTDGKRRVWRKLHLAVGCQKLYGSNKHWKKKYGYHKRSLSETAMFRVKKLLGGTLSLRNYNAQVGETYAMIKALNKLTGLGMPETMVIALLGVFLTELGLGNKAGFTSKYSCFNIPFTLSANAF